MKLEYSVDSNTKIPATLYMLDEDECEIDIATFESWEGNASTELNEHATRVCDRYNKYDALLASHENLKKEVSASNNRLKTVFAVLPEDYRKSVEIQMRFNEQALAEAKEIEKWSQ